MSILIDKIDETRKKWINEIRGAHTALLNYSKEPLPIERALVELDYLLVEAKFALRGE